MSLKTLVKVGNISNLNDARYCAGMGVDFLAFNVVEGQEHYLPPERYQEIKGWISGPKTVAAIYGLADNRKLDSLLEAYQPDLLETDLATLKDLSPPATLGLIVSPETLDDALSQLAEYRVAFIQLEPHQLGAAALFSQYPVLAKLPSVEKLSALLEHQHIRGLALTGGIEPPPGQESHYGLADVLEQLEEY